MCSCNHRHTIQSDDDHGCLSPWLSAVEVAEGLSGTLYRSIPASFVRWHQPHWRNPWGSICQGAGTFAAAVVVAIENRRQLDMDAVKSSPNLKCNTIPFYSCGDDGQAVGLVVAVEEEAFSSVR